MNDVTELAWRRVSALIRGNLLRRPPSQPPFRRLVDQVLADELADVDEPTVVILSDQPDDMTQAWVAAARRRARIHRMRGTSKGNDLHVAIAAVGPCDLIIDETDTPDRVARVRDLLFQLRVGGVLLLRRRSRRNPGVADRAADVDRQQLAELLHDVAGADSSSKQRGPAGDRARFGRSVRTVRLRAGHLMLINGQHAQAKIREEWIERLLTLRPSLGEVIDIRQGVEWSLPNPIRQSPSEHQPYLPTRWTAPRAVLRRYNDVVSSPGQVVATESLILPDSYRHNFETRLHNSYVHELSALFADTDQPTRFARTPPPEGPRRLSGSYFHLDNEARGHFGHMVTEPVSRLWGWPLAKSMIPDLRVIMHMNKGRELASWEVDLLSAAGIPAEDIVFTHDPVRVEHLVDATPLFGNPVYAHPAITEVWARMGENLERRSDVAVPDRIFVGRRLTKRACRNASEVEDFFRNHGFTVIYPEDYPLPDQVRIFRRTKAIAGFAGSGMFQMMFAGPGKPVIIVCSESYRGRNEVLIAQVLGQDLSLAWCRSEGAWDGTRSVRGAYHAPFTFDFDREGRFVRDVIAGLPN